MAAPSKDNPTGVGRHARAGEPAAPFTLKLTAKERATYQTAATASGRTLGQWFRAAADVAVGSPLPRLIIGTDLEDELLDEALRLHTRRDDAQQPSRGLSTVDLHEGEHFVVLRNRDGELARYLIGKGERLSLVKPKRRKR